MSTYPRTIENGHGERITFLRRVQGPGGERLEVESFVTPGSGPPMHVHHLQAEGLTVRQGRVGYQRLGEPARFAGPGESVEFSPGEPHKFWNAGTDDLVCAGYIQPADNAEFFLTSLYESVKSNGGGRPNAFDAAFLLTRYRTEIGLLEIPVAVQKFVFPVQVAIGHILGKYRKYAGAPEPVRRAP